MKEYKYKINGTEYKVGIGDIDNDVAEVEVNGTPYKVQLEHKAAPAMKISAPKAAAAPRTATGEKVIAKATVAAPAGGTPVKAPLPGTVMDILFAVGQEVKASDTVVVLEAMKMENAIKAGVNGKVASIAVAKGDAVAADALLMTIA